MTARTRAKIFALVIAAVLVLYFVMSIRIAWALLGSGDAVNIALGVGMIILPVLGAWLIGREVMFGFQAEHLLKRMESEGSLPEDSLPKLASGRPDRAAADAEFPKWKAEAEEEPESWRAWYRLGLAYRASGDNGRARASVRRAIELERAESRAGDAATA